MFEKSIPNYGERYLRELELCRKRLYLDPVTNLLNRNGFLERFPVILRSEPSLTAIGIEIPNIYEIQRNYGHEVAEHYLRCFANKIRIILRKALINACLSTDLFLSVIPSKDAEEIETLALKIRYYLQGPFLFRGGIFPMRARICACLLEEKDVDVLSLLTIIRNVLAENREEIKIVSYAEEREKISGNLPLFLHLSRKITMGQIGFALQPVVESGDHQQVAFYEVLARIPSKEEKLIKASEFMKKVEELGLKRDLERTVLYKAMVYLHEHSEVERISINISPDYLISTFESDLQQFLSEIKIDPRRILIEIIEKSDISRNRDKVFKDKLCRLREQGFGIALDDFGQDHSNINLLKEFPWEMVKIDGTFILHLLENEIDLELIRFLVRLSSLKGFRLVAEFVENQELATLLKELGVHLLQGYHVGAPKFISESVKILPPLLYRVAA